MRLVDFQIDAGSWLPVDDGLRIGQALFTTFEAVRLWLRERSVQAPFRKLVVGFEHRRPSVQHGHVMNVLGICQVKEAVDTAVLLERAADHRWVLDSVAHALGCVARETGWRCEELEDFIGLLSNRPLPLVHFFGRLARVDRPSGIRCVPWLSVRPGETRIGVRIGERDIEILSKPEPIYLEDDFPMVTSAIRGREFVLLDSAGKTLASVSIGQPAFLE